MTTRMRDMCIQAYEAGVRDGATYWRRSALGTWAVNLALSGVIAWLLWGPR